MNTYDFTDLHIGMTEESTVTVKEENIQKFFEITGDANPLHRDASYAVAQGYPDCAVYGMLTASYYSTLAGVYLPGENSLIHGVDAKFLKPVFVGDTLTVEGKVSEKNDTYKLLIIKASIRNQDGEKVSRATIRVGVLE